jgi:hypothetical protein
MFNKILRFIIIFCSLFGSILNEKFKNILFIVADDLGRYILNYLA